MQYLDDEKYIWLPMKAYCKLRKITRKTCWLIRKEKRVVSKLVGRRVYIAIEKNECLLNKENKYFVFINFKK